jgi:amino acid transporter
MFAAEQFSTGSNSSTFAVVLYLATSTTLLSYLLIFPAAVRLRQTHGHVPRPYRVPGGSKGLWLFTGVITAWMVLGSWVALFPGTLERLFGKSYNIHDVYGVTRMRFEVFTLGTLVIILAIGVVGYWMGAPVRADEVDVSLVLDEELAPAS